MYQIDEVFLKKVTQVVENARKNLKTAVNIAMVYTYFEIGKMIVEEEQNGSDRAKYGKYIIKRLSAVLTRKDGKGYSMDNLDVMRKIYSV